MLTRDALKRMHTVETKCGGNGYKRGYNYATRGETAYPVGTTNYVDRISYYNVVNNVATFEKAENIEYNADGNIVVYGENSYVYDGLGRLIRENNKALDKTFLFEYNVGGNIMYRSEFPYTTGTPSALIKIYDYGYSNTWKDQLTSYDYTPITYDASGNPISYLGATLTWSRGRLLTKYVNGSKTVNIQYDARGFRRSSTKVMGTTTSDREYIYSDDGRLLYDRVNTFDRYYLYGQDGIVGFEEDGVVYTYRKNLFGDVTAIYQGTTKVAEYVYDAWGNCTITTNVNGFGTRNAIRYRGYYWDNDLNMYYLLSRYYDPQTGRFINADTPEYLKPTKINGLNLYAYCRNNPVMHTDPYGTDISYTWGGDEGYNPYDEWWIYSGSNGAAGGYYGENTAYHTYSVYSNTAAYDAYHGGYYYSGVSSGVLNPTYYIVPGATTVTDSMATPQTYIYNDVIDLPKSGSAINKTDLHHNFPNIVDNYAGYSTRFHIKNGTLYQVEGSYRGDIGRFEWIVQNGYVTHRFFVIGGKINGTPSK